MTASEAGHEAVVDLLLEHNSCNINARNSYGQIALCLAAISGQVLVVLRLLQDERVDVECVSGGLSIAEKTCSAGFTELANILASAARQSQVANIMHAVMVFRLRRLRLDHTTHRNAFCASRGRARQGEYREPCNRR
jgi:ankyrin repeat protein